MKSQIKPGERPFMALLTLIGVWFTWESYKLFREDPTLSSFGALPLILGILMTFMSAILLVKSILAENPAKGLPQKEKLLLGIKHLFPPHVSVMILLLVIYTATFFAGVTFWVSTPVYLWVAIAYLHRKDYLKNVIWIGCMMLFIFLVFKLAFRVIFP